jgi:uncharacterized protein (DUF58 family)
MSYRIVQPSSLYTVGLIWFIAACLLFAALLKKETELALFCLVLLGFIIMARMWGKYSRTGFDVSVDTDRPRLFPGESFTLTIRADNRKLLPVWIQTQIDIPEFMASQLEDTQPTLNAALLWRQSASLEWNLTAPRRGVYLVGPRQVRVGDLMGLFPNEVKSSVQTELIVYPRLRSVAALDLPRREFHGAPSRISPVTDPVYLMGTREYQPGRPARYIHWKASARHQRWQEKIFEPAAQKKVLFSLDVAGFAETEAVDAFENTLEIIASLALRYHRSGVHVGFVSNGRTIGGHAAVLPAAGSARQPVTLLEILARLKMEPAGSAIECIALGPFKHPGLTIVHVVREYDETAAQVKTLLDRRRQSIVFLVHDWDPETANGNGIVTNGIRPLNNVNAEAASL